MSPTSIPPVSHPSDILERRAVQQLVLAGFRPALAQLVRAMLPGRSELFAEGEAVASLGVLLALAKTETDDEFSLAIEAEGGVLLESATFRRRAMSWARYELQRWIESGEVD